MKSVIFDISCPEDNRFKTISEFKECLVRGGEVTFIWNHVQYGVFKKNLRYCIALANGEKEKWCDTTDELLEYMVGDDRLRDVIPQVTVTERTI